jgi:hypothetical protein
MFDDFYFYPPMGLLVVLSSSGKVPFPWHSCFFQNNFASSVQFTSVHNNSTWILTNIYAPCTPLGKKISLGGLEIFKWQIMLIG